MKDQLPETSNSDYDYAPKPMVNIPPVSQHEFYIRFYGCRKRGSLYRSSACKRLQSCDTLSLLSLLPKKRSAREEGGDARELFWGIYARERVSLASILLYNVACIFPMFMFVVLWLLPLEHRGDL